MDPPVSLERLLAERGWLRALARRLVADPGAADDAEQETWAAALTRRPRGADAVRGWLAAVLRNALRDRARSETSRARREQAVARPEATRSTAEVVARADLQRRLVQAVFDLDPPLREAVLLRYFEDLPFAEVGARLGVTADAARMRVRRGIEALRARFDGDDADGRGGRGAWRGAFVLWLGATEGAGTGGGRAPAGGATLIGGLAMAGAKKAVVAVVLLALAGAAVWGVATSRSSKGPSGEAPSAATGTDDAARADGADRARHRARVVETAPETPPAQGTASAAPTAAPHDWAIRVTTNVPGAEVTVTFKHYGAAPESPPATKRTDANGFAGFDLPEHPDVLAEADAHAAAPGHAPARGEVRDGAVTLTLAPGVPVRGRVVADTGAPIEGATISVAADRWTSSAADGTFEVWPSAAGAVTLSVGDTAHLPAKRDVTAPADGVEVVLGTGRRISGRVAFPDLRPLPGVNLQAWADGRFVLATTDDDGRYVLTGLPDGEFEVSCGARGGKRRASAGATDVDFVVTSAVARVRFVDEEGRPFRNAALKARGFVGDREVFSSASAGGSDPVHLIALPPGARLQVSPSANGYERRVVEVTLDGEPSLRDVPVVIRREGPTGAIDLRVVDASGAPRRETVVSIDNEADAVVGGWYGKKLALDADGRARIDDLPPGALRITVGGGRAEVPTQSYDLTVTRDVAMSAGASVPVEVAMLPGGRIVVSVRNAAGDVVAPRGWLTVVDSAGTRVPGTFWQENADGGWTSSSDPDAPKPSHFGPVVPAGAYRVRLEREGRDTVEVDASVVAGRTTEVDLRLGE